MRVSTLTRLALGGSPALKASWSAPRSDHPIRRYEVQYRRTSSTSWRRKITTSTFVYLSSLYPGTTYHVQVRAVSDGGTGAFSSTASRTTYRRELGRIGKGNKTVYIVDLLYSRHLETEKTILILKVASF